MIHKTKYISRLSTGFSLLQIVIAIFIIGLLMTIVIPNLRPRIPRHEREQFVAQLNSLMQFAWQQAVITHKKHAITFNFERRTIAVLEETDQKKQDGTPVFRPVKGQFMRSLITWPENLQIKEFFLEGDDLLKKFVGRATGEVDIYLVPEGLAQDVIINMIDTKEKVGGRPKQMGLVLNPFSAQFKVYGTFQKY
jgi:type II secretory pathway pseudopilin PulG